MNRITGHGLAIIVLASFVSGCGSSPDAACLDLTWEEFDQNLNGGRCPLADAGDYAGAASMIENYLNHREDLLDAQRGYSTFHAGQLWALHGETERVLGLLDRATVDDAAPEFPRAFNPLVLGSFLHGFENHCLDLLDTLRRVVRKIALLKRIPSEIGDLPASSNRKHSAFQVSVRIPVALVSSTNAC